MEQFDQSTILKVAKQTLIKEPRQRTDNQIKQMCKLVENIEFFQKYSEDNYEVIKSCCKFMTLEMVTSQNPVMMIDTEGDKFYLILQGKVAIYIRKQVIIEDSPNKKVLEKRQPIVNPLEQESFTKGLDKVAELQVGQSFGEMALQTAGGSRTATIMCLEDCYFGVLIKKDFIQILKNQERNNDIKSMGSFTSNPLVEALKFPERLYVYKNSDIKKYSHQEVVFFENQKPTHIYIVKCGEFLLSKFYEKPILDNDDDIILVNVIRKQKNLKQKMKLKIVGEEEIIGLDQIYNDMHTYELSCNSQHGELLRIEKSLYQNKIVGNQLAKRFAENLATIKSSQNDLRIQFVSNHFENLASKLTNQRLKSTADSSSDLLQMHVQLKKKFSSPLSLFNSKGVNKETSLLINDPMMKLQKIVSPMKNHNHGKSRQNSRSKLISYSNVAPRTPILTKQGSDRNISFDSSQTRDIFHFRSPTTVFDRIMKKKKQFLELTTMTQTSKQFVHKTKFLPFLTVSNFLPKKIF